jgi:lipoate-protein ligase A
VNEQTAWRLVLSSAADGPTNMAVDEAILQAVAAGHSPATLRFYGWQPPCLSLGVAQPCAEADLARLAALGWDMVRRPTGGRAILHTDEFTYSIIAPRRDPRVAGTVVESYRRLSQGLLAGLQFLGLLAEARSNSAPRRRGTGPVCFEVPSGYEITTGGKKLVGSAQARKQGVILQHGTLPLTGDLGRICDALAFDNDAERRAARARVLQRATTLEGALGRHVCWEEAAGAIASGFEQALKVALEPGALTPEERKAAALLRAEKYGSPTWTHRH